jgi:periplasmic divalent cation tolerance protein
MEKIVLVLTTIPDEFDAASLARTLVEAGHAACVSILAPHQSTYRWQGVIETATEHQVLFKTTAGRVDRLRAALRDLHPYDLPEFLVLPITGGDEDYLKWVRGSVGP